LVGLCIITLLASGAILTFERLSQQGINNTYLAVLTLKLVTSATLILLSRSMGRAVSPLAPAPVKQVPDPSPRLRLTRPRVALILGMAVFFLAGMLSVLYEKGLSAL
jgi:hypothetical protein